MTGIITRYNAWRRRMRENTHRQRRALMEQTFQVEERAGELIITKDGVAIHHFTHHSSAYEIVDALRATRETAIKFSSHELS